MAVKKSSGRGGRKMNSDVLDEKIQRAQERVVSAKAAYEFAVKNLQELMEKRDALRKDELYSLLLKSNKPYDEVVRFLKSGTKE